MAGASGPVHVQGCEKQGKSRRWVQPGVWCWRDVHQGSVLSPVLFIIVLEALSREFRTGCPWELLYADDLMISAESMEELLVKVHPWKTEMEKKGLRVNMGKTKIMESTPVVSVSQELVALMQSSVVAASAECIRNAVTLRDPCALTLSSGAPDALGLLGLLMKEKFQRLRLKTKSLKLSQSSATLGTCSLQEVAAIIRGKCAWGKFRQLLPLLTNRHLPLLT